MEKTERKHKLNLTVAGDAKERARELAKKTRRSLSSLFETLIDEEWERANVKEEATDAYGKKDLGQKQKKIGFRDSLRSEPMLTAAISALVSGVSRANAD
jgi:hypothetical protein